MHDSICPLMNHESLKNMVTLEYMTIGEEMIKNNRVGVVMMAAG